MSITGTAVGALRWFEYAGLLGFIGVVLVRRLGANPPAIRWARPPMQLALAMALAGGAGTLAAEAWITGSVPASTAARVAAEALALTLCLTVGRLAVPTGLVAAVTVAFAGHAARLHPAAPAVAVDALHVLAAGSWAGGIAVLATLRPPGGWRSEEGRALLQRFGRVATIAFAITALTGVLSATEELTAVSDLWTTEYGAVLAVKTAGVVAMLAMSVLIWRRGLPLLKAEAALALAVMGATGLLAAFPTPPSGP
jgi:putative copper export protein